MYPWAAYHKRPTLTLIDIHNMPPQWKAPEYKPIDPLPGRWPLAIAAAPLRGVYHVLSVPETPTTDQAQALRLDALNQAGEIVETIVLPSALGSQLPRRSGGWPWKWKWNLAINNSQQWAITIADTSGRVSIVMGNPDGEVSTVIPTEAMACEDFLVCHEAGFYFEGQLDGQLELAPSPMQDGPVVLDSRYDRLLSVGGVKGVRTLTPLPKAPFVAPILDGAGHVETAEIGNPRGVGNSITNGNDVPRLYSSGVARNILGPWRFVEAQLSRAGYQSFPVRWVDGKVSMADAVLYSEFGPYDPLRHRRVALGEDRWMALPERCQILKTDRSRAVREEAVACPYPSAEARQWPDDLSFDHERNLLALASRSGELSRWTQDGQFLGQVNLSRKGYVRQVRVGRAADGAERLVAATSAGNLDVYDLASGDFVVEIPVQRYGQPAHKLSYAMDERGRIFVADDAAEAIDVYAPGEGPPAPTPTAAPPAEGCRVVGRKLASPGRVTLGDTVAVSLGMQVHCADAMRPSGLDLVLMAERGSRHVQHVQRLDTAARTLLSTLDWTRDRVTLLIDGRTVITASSSLTEVMAPLVTMERVAQDPRPTLAEVFSRAEASLARSSRADALPVFLLLGDLRENETDLKTMRPVVGRLAGKGISRFLLVLRPLSPSSYLTANLNEIAGGADRFWLQPLGLEFEELGDRLQALVNGGIAGGVSVADVLGDTMAFEDGSALPSAVLSADRRSLFWQLPLLSAEGVTLTYRLRPQALGRHATNRFAELRYRDGAGVERSFTFEQPWIEVLAPTATPSPSPSPSPEPTATAVRPRVYLPLLRREHCADFGQAVDLVLVVDASSSMAGRGQDGRSRLEAARQAAASLLDGLGLRSASNVGPRQVAIVSFASEARLVQPLTADRSALDRALAGLALQEGSRIDLAMQAAHDEVQGRRHRREAGKAVVLLSDGQVEEAQGRSAIAAADAAKADGVSLFVIALGSGADQTLLEAMAAPGQFYAAPEPAELLDIYRRIAELVRCR